MDLIQLQALKNKLTREGRLAVQVVSDSMHPLLVAGGTYELVDAPYTELKPWDIIGFYQGGQIIVHFVRYQNHHDSAWVTGALKNPQTRDLPVTADRYLGRLCVKIPLHQRLSWLARHYFF